MHNFYAKEMPALKKAFKNPDIRLYPFEFGRRVVIGLISVLIDKENRHGAVDLKDFVGKGYYTTWKTDSIAKFVMRDIARGNLGGYAYLEDDGKFFLLRSIALDEYEELNELGLVHATYFNSAFSLVAVASTPSFTDYHDEEAYRSKANVGPADGQPKNLTKLEDDYEVEPEITQEIASDGCDATPLFDDEDFS